MPISLEDLEVTEIMGPRLLVQQSRARDPEGIILPDNFADETTFCQIIDVGPDCLHFTEAHIGGFVHAPLKHPGINRLTDDQYPHFLITEEALQVHQDFGVYWFEDGE